MDIADHNVDWSKIDWGNVANMNLPCNRKAAAEAPLKQTAKRSASDKIETDALPPRLNTVNPNLPWLRGYELKWGSDEEIRRAYMSKRLIAYSRYANNFEDINTVIELMLTEARDATHADGGTFYLVTPEGNLRFSYFQNATLSRGRHQSRNHYVNAEMPISDSSIGGYVALSKQILNIPSVERIDPAAPYKFNRSFDKSSGYNTISMLTVPVLGTGGDVLAVLQLINSLDDNGVPKPFDPCDMEYLELLSLQSTPFLTKSLMTRLLLDTMLHISEIRDPTETGVHVQRVGAIAAEIYDQWARDHQIPYDELMIEKDILRLAAMLHDIGKIGVPDAILKKPGKLTDEEYDIIKTHCALGAAMYAKRRSRLEQVSYEITLYHHQRWDGKGYTGDPNIKNLSGNDIPIYARITSVADVIDALANPRVYKEAWTFERVFEELARSSGAQFDPEVVTAATAIKDTIEAIIKRYN